MQESIFCESGANSETILKLLLLGKQGALSQDCIKNGGQNDLFIRFSFLHEGSPKIVEDNSFPKIPIRVLWPITGI